MALPSAPIYLDYAATTPTDPRVIEAMSACLGREGLFGNPASRSHIYGWQAEEAVENARVQVAELLQADTREIVWTSGATESNNLAIKGVYQHACKAKGGHGHIITSRAEHKAVLDVCQWLEATGAEVTYLQPDELGIISSAQVEQALRPDTYLVSLMHVNNETGVITDIESIGAIVQAHGAMFHVDAAQSAGKLPLAMPSLNVDLLSLSAHKMYGPKGIGALYVRRSPEVSIEAQIHGGGHERKMRSGTLATHQIVGLGEAANIALAEQASEQAKTEELKTLFWQKVKELPGIQLNGDPNQRIAGTLNISFGEKDSEQVMLALRGLAVSSGSACTSASVEPSHVLTGMGLGRGRADSAIRFSFGRFTTKEQISNAVTCVTKAVHTLGLTSVSADAS